MVCSCAVREEMLCRVWMYFGGRPGLAEFWKGDTKTAGCYWLLWQQRIRGSFRLVTAVRRGTLAVH